MADSANGRRILVVGDVIDDVVVVPHGPIRPDTDTVSDIRFTAGGSASNTASWLGHAGAEVEFVGMVGHADVVRHTAEFEKYGVVAHLQSHATLPTGAIVILIDGESRSMLTERGANDSIDLSQLTTEYLSRFSMLHLTGYSLFCVADSTAVSDLIVRARAAGLEVCVDPGSAGFLADYGVERFLAAIDGASILVPNLEEGRALTGLDDPAEIAQSLSARGGLVAVTLDRAGVVVSRAGAAAMTIAAATVQTVDPTGAGDAFTAGFLSGLLSSDDVETAAAAGNNLAATAVTSLGARPKRA